MTYRQTETPTVAAAKAGSAPRPPLASNTIRGCHHKRKRRVAIRFSIQIAALQGVAYAKPSRVPPRGS